MLQNDFNKILLSAVDESLSSLGDSSKQAILFHLENSFDMKKESIPTNLTEFKKALEGIFGSGADYIEDIIVKHLHQKLGLIPQDGANRDFLGNVETIKFHMASKGEIGSNENRKKGVKAHG